MVELLAVIGIIAILIFLCCPGFTVPADQFFAIRLAATPDAAKAGGLASTLYINDLLAGDNMRCRRLDSTM